MAGVTLSNPDKVLWPEHDGPRAITKADLARYMEVAAERILPHVADRPVSIIRAPEGVGGGRGQGKGQESVHGDLGESQRGR